MTDDDSSRGVSQVGHPPGYLRAFHILLTQCGVICNIARDGGHRGFQSLVPLTGGKCDGKVLVTVDENLSIGEALSKPKDLNAYCRRHRSIAERRHVERVR